MSDRQSIAVAVVCQGEAVLIGRRPEGVPLAGYWEFPGGKVEPEEMPQAAAVRECREETGLQVRVLRAFPRVLHEYQHARVELHFFACGLTDPGDPAPPFQWVPRELLGGYLFPDANHSLVAWLQEHDLASWLAQS